MREESPERLAAISLQSSEHFGKSSAERPIVCWTSERLSTRSSAARYAKTSPARCVKLCASTRPRTWRNKPSPVSSAGGPQLARGTVGSGGSLCARKSSVKALGSKASKYAPSMILRPYALTWTCPPSPCRPASWDQMIGAGGRVRENWATAVTPCNNCEMEAVPGGLRPRRWLPSWRWLPSCWASARSPCASQPFLRLLYHSDLAATFSNNFS